MTKKRKIDIFSAGCTVCDQAIEEIRASACPSCEIEIHDLRDRSVAALAKSFSIGSLPAVVIDGVLAECCWGRGPNISTLRAAGLGQPIQE